MPVKYPMASDNGMDIEGPADPAFAVPDATLVHNPHRHPHFPYLYRLREPHPLVNANDAIKESYVYIQDTSDEARSAMLLFEDSLRVPLGRDADMDPLGLFELRDGCIIFARALGCSDPMEDVLIAFAIDGERVNKEWMIELKAFQTRFLGMREHRTLTRPDADLKGGTHFERLGQEGVKGARCFSLTLTHQFWRALVCPSAGGKILEKDKITENGLLRKDGSELHARIATEVLKKVAPTAFVDSIEQNAVLNNLVGVGHPCNHAFPAMQANIAPAVRDNDCGAVGLEEMGFFGHPDGHRDLHDSPGALTFMIVNSDIPEGYECGRFHLLALGVYIKLKMGTVTGFCGLNKHGGTPPIAPVNQEVVNYAYRLITVCYPPMSMMSGAGVNSIPLAGLPENGILNIGPEISTPRNVRIPVTLSNQASWATDGHIIMQKHPHMMFLVRSLVQLTQYILDQLPESYKAELNAQAFSDAITFLDEDDRKAVALPVIDNPDQQLEDWIVHMKKQAKFVPHGVNLNFDKLVQDLGGNVALGLNLRRKQRGQKTQTAAVPSELKSRGKPGPKFLSQYGHMDRELLKMTTSRRKQKRKAVASKPNVTSERESELSEPESEEPLDGPGCYQLSHNPPINKGTTFFADDPFSIVDGTDHATPAIGVGRSIAVQSAEHVSPSGELPIKPTLARGPAEPDEESDADADDELDGDEDFIEDEGTDEDWDWDSDDIADSSSDSDYAEASTSWRPKKRAKLEKTAVQIIEPPRCLFDILAGVSANDDLDVLINSDPEDAQMDDGLEAASSLANGVIQESQNGDGEALGGRKTPLTPPITNTSRAPSVDLADSPEVSAGIYDRPICQELLNSFDQKSRYCSSACGTSAVAILDELNARTFHRTISDFERALAIRDTGFLASDVTSKTMNTCTKVLTSIRIRSGDPKTAASIPAFWNTHNLYQSYTDVVVVDARIAQGRVMQLTWEAHRWLQDLIHEALNPTPNHPTTWTRSLMFFLSTILEKRANIKTHQSISSAQFLPDLLPPRMYSFQCPNSFCFDNCLITGKLVQTHATNAIRTWLQFPTEQEIGLQVAMIDSLTFGMVEKTSLLMLDPVWRFYCNPQKLLSTCASKQRSEAKHKGLQVNLFQHLYSYHVLQDPSSELAMLEQRLDNLIHEWSDFTTTKRAGNKRPRANMQLPSPSATPQPELELTSNEGYAMQFIQFLRRVYPYLNPSKNVYTFQDKLLTTIARNPDYHLPFRQHAPTMLRALSTIYSDPERLKTKIGLWNLVCFRGVFFGSVWAKTSLVWMNTYKDWERIYSAVQANRASLGGAASHFVNKAAYGSAIRQREIALIKKYYENLPNDWESFIRTQAKTPKWKVLFDYIKRNFFGIGNLIALLVVGDLIECGLLPKPSLQEWGNLIHSVNAGAADGLLLLRMIDGVKGRKKKRTQLLHALEKLDGIVRNSFDAAEINAMGYDPIMLEHALCKFKRSRWSHKLVPGL